MVPFCAKVAADVSRASAGRRLNLNEALSVLSVQNEDEDWPVALVDGMFFYYLALEGRH
jgi:hypothetical protein